MGFYKNLLKTGPIIWGLGLVLGRVGWLPDWSNFVQKTGIICFGIGCLLGVINFINDKYQITRSIDFRVIDRDEINRVIKIAKKTLKQSPSRNEIKQVLNLRNDIVIVQVHKYQIFGWNYERVTGFLSIFPLNDNVISLLDNENISVRQFSGQHIASKGSAYSSIYVGGIASLYSGIAITGYLRGLLDNERQNGLKSIYTNPTTKIGLRLAKSAGFRPVDDMVEEGTMNRIYKLNL